MLRTTRTHLTYANVIATVSLFVALGGSSYAAVSLTRDSVRTGHIKNGQVKAVDVADGSIRMADMNKSDVSEMKNRDEVRVTRLRGAETSFVQQANEVVELVGQVSVTPPAGCSGGGVMIEVLLDKTVVLSGYTSEAASTTPTSGPRRMALTVDEAGANLLFEPGADTTRELTIRADDGCEGGDYSIDTVAIDVLRYR